VTGAGETGGLKFEDLLLRFVFRRPHPGFIKGMVALGVLPAFLHTDLRDERLAVRFRVYHRRFSTNTLPPLALASRCWFWSHNGEIQIPCWQSQLARPPNPTSMPPGVPPAADPQARCGRGRSAILPILDAMLELMCAAAGQITDCLLTLVPEAPFASSRYSIPAQECGHFYEYSACLQEPWDGPAFAGLS